MTVSQVVWFVVSVLAFAAVGSFCCVVIDRWPASVGDLLGGQSRCSSCGEPVRGRDNVPVVSWFLLRGRCRRCHSGIPGYHPIVEAVVPAMWVVSFLALGWRAELAVVAAATPVAVTAAGIAARGGRGLHRPLWSASAVVLVSTAVIAVVRGEPDPLVGCVVGQVALGAPPAAVRAVRADGFSVDDVALAVFLGGPVGVVGAIDGYVTSAVWGMVALTLAAVVAVVQAGVRRHSNDAISFGPALVAGWCVAIGLSAALV